MLDATATGRNAIGPQINGPNNPDHAPSRPFSFYRCRFPRFFLARLFSFSKGRDSVHPRPAAPSRGKENHPTHLRVCAGSKPAAWQFGLSPAIVWGPPAILLWGVRHSLVGLTPLLITIVGALNGV
jgi:hypothetical protein